jgi:hypothetical protein
LRRACRSLPSVRASSDFTERVLARLAAGETRQHRQLRWAAAALLVTVAGIGGLWEVSERRDETRQQRKAEALRRESRAIERELETLRSLAAGGEPSLYLGGTEGYEVVMSLSPWLEAPAASPRLASDRQ